MTDAGNRLLAIFRRKFVSLASAAILGPFLPRPAMALQGGTMYGRIGKIMAAFGQRDALAAILLASSQSMPGCLSYVIAADAADHDTLWITEVWDSAASHRNRSGSLRCRQPSRKADDSSPALAAQWRRHRSAATG